MADFNYHLEELNELEQALSQSPSNQTLRYMLARKLFNFTEYAEAFEYHLNQLIQQNHSHTDGKCLLLKHYYRSEKYSACIILAEELLLEYDLAPEIMAIISKAYLKDDNPQKSQKIYQQLLQEHPNFKDDELDQNFRLGHELIDLEELMEDDIMEKPDINFDDVGGLDAVKREIDLKIIKPLEHAELYAQYGKKIGGGILMYGPPGCGKTYLARATAGQINAKFINVGLNDILDMWIGNSEKNLHEIFDVARHNSPCVLFFDEIDALGAKRSDLKQSAGKTVINQFLSELDGVASSNEGILIIGATNCPWHLDPAFRRPGRFDRIIFVPPPDQKGKEEILNIALKTKPTENIDIEKVAKKAKSYSGADINAMIDIAVEQKLEKAIETGIPEPLVTKDLLQAIERHNASTVDWFTTAKNYAMFANQSGLYDDILKYLKK